MPTYSTPTLGSVPGSSGIDFDWWTAVADPTSLRFSPDNPNWLGAFSLSEGAGSLRVLTFRALKGTIGGQQYLLLSWIIRVSELDIVGSADYLNIILGAGGQYVALQAVLGTASSTVGGSVTGTQNAGTFSYEMHDCTVAGGQITQVNPALSVDGAALEGTARMWVDVIAPTRGLTTRWAFQMAVPLGIAWGPSTLVLPTNGAFKLWYEGWKSLPNGMVSGPLQVPTTPPNIKTEDQTQIVPVNPSKLLESQMLDMTTAAGGDLGVEMNWGNIGTRNVDAGDPARSGTTDIRLDLGQAYPPNMAAPPTSTPYNETITPNVTLSKNQNQFFAQPTFPFGFAGPQTALRGRFSLANWGSQLADSTANSWRPIPGLEDVPWQAGPNEMRQVWPLGPNADAYTTTLVRNINKFLNISGTGGKPTTPAQNPHQCVLVEISSTDPSVVITRSSVFQNMNVANVSTFRRLAEISVVGLTPISSRPRDVYLYLQTFNMPKKAPSPPDPRGVPGVANMRSMASSRPKPTEVEEIAAFAPTYIVHAFHDTGETLKVKSGKKLPILRPQTSFGYFAQHEGDLIGWETRIYGAEKLADNFYVVRVPNNGSTYVETAIQARENQDERPLPDDGKPIEMQPQGCLAWLLGLFGKK